MRQCDNATMYQCVLMNYTAATMNLLTHYRIIALTHYRIVALSLVQLINITIISPFLVKIQTVTYQKFIGNRKANIINFYVKFQGVRFV